VREEQARTNDAYLTKIEKLKRLMNRGVSEEDAAVNFSMPLAVIRGMLAFEDCATPETKDAVRAGRLSASAAAELTKITDPAAQNDRLADLIGSGEKVTARKIKIATKQAHGKSFAVSDKKTQAIDEYTAAYTRPVSISSYASEPRRAIPEGEKSRDRARALADATPPKLRAAYARAFCAEVVSRYWTKLAPRPQQCLRAFVESATKPTLRSEALTVAEHVAELAAKGSLEDAAYLTGRIYAAMLPEDVRAKQGVYYTPPSVAFRLLELAQAAGVDWSTARVIDPACGGGAFLGPIARLMIRGMHGADRRVVLRNLSTRLHGYEIDAFASWLSMLFLDATLNEELGVTAGNELSPVAVCDSLTKIGQPPEFDLVIGNPPYGRVTLPPSQRDLYRRSLYGHANLYGLFMDLALHQVKVGGVIAYVTPTSFLSGEYFRNLRELLVSTAPPLSLDFVSRRAGVFDDVLQETILATFKQQGAPLTTSVHFLDVGIDTVSTTATEAIPVPSTREPWIVPRTPDSTTLVKRLRGMTSRLADWGYQVSTGPLVWNRFKNRLRDKRSARAVPLIWAEAVSADGVFGFRAARRNHAPYFEVDADEDFLLVRSPCVLLQRTTAKEQPRRLIAAELPQSFLDQHGGAVTVENHLNMLVPTRAPDVTSSVAAAFLNSSAADRVFRCISGSVAVSAYELESMPIPPAEGMKRLASAVAQGASRAAVDTVCEQLYGGE
jgi:adenine-specific DNA-methyltransferase